MTYPIRFIEHPVLHADGTEFGYHYNGTVDFQKLAIGDMCYYHYQGQPCKDPEHLQKLNLTQHYCLVNSGRPPLILALPNASSKNPLYFMVDGQCYSSHCTKCSKAHSQCKCGDAYEPRGHYDGWTVTGAPPNITVSPSVNYDDAEYNIKHYHGHIQNGVIGNG